MKYNELQNWIIIDEYDTTNYTAEELKRVWELASPKIDQERKNTKLIIHSITPLQFKEVYNKLWSLFSKNNVV